MLQHFLFFLTVERMGFTLPYYISWQVKEALREHFQGLWIFARRETCTLLPKRMLTALFKFFSSSRAATRAEVKSTFQRELYI